MLTMHRTTALAHEEPAARLVLTAAVIGLLGDVVEQLQSQDREERYAFAAPTVRVWGIAIFRVEVIHSRRKGLKRHFHALLKR
jgi:hypothetical protein